MNEPVGNGHGVVSFRETILDVRLPLMFSCPVVVVNFSLINPFTSELSKGVFRLVFMQTVVYCSVTSSVMLPFIVLNSEYYEISYLGIIRLIQA